MNGRNRTAATECGDIEIFTTGRTGTVFGYRLVGALPGPQLVVAGICPAAARVFDRLLSIPTLPWMRGNLVMVQLDALEDLVGDISSMVELGPVDRTIVLPGGTETGGGELLIRRNYHAVLRACADLGMIAGKGVSRLH